MKFRSIALVLTLALSLVGWAQETPAPSAAPNSTPTTQSKPCCHHAMAATGAKDAASCCGKDKCEMKDGKSCCDAKNMKAAMKECKKNGCCADGKSCREAKGDKTAMGCCSNKCERHPQAPAGS